MSVARRNLKEAGGETRPRRTGIGYKANDRGVSRPIAVTPESCPDAAGVNPAGTAGKRRGLPWEASGSVRRLWTTASAMALDGSGGVSRRHSTGPGRAVPGRAKPLGAGSRPDDSMCVGPQEKTRRASSSWRGAPLGRRRGRKPICAHRGAASVVGVGGESSLGAEVLGATKLRGTAGYETRTSGGVGGRGARAPLLPVCGPDYVA